MSNNNDILKRPVLWIIIVWVIAAGMIVSVLMISNKNDKEKVPMQESKYIMDTKREFYHSENQKWIEKSGKWTISAEEITADSGVIYREEKAGNFTYTVTVDPVEGVGEVIFRTNNDPTKNGYAVRLSPDGTIILKQQPNLILAEEYVDAGKHTIKVITYCENIKVYIDEELKIEAESNSFPAGRYALAAENGTVKFSNISAYIGPRPKLEDVAKKITALPEQMSDALKLELPDLGREYVVNVYASDNSSVVDRSGNIVPPIKEQTVSVVLNIIDRKDYSQVLTSEIKVKIPARTIDPSVVLSASAKEDAVLKLKRMRFDDGDAKYEELKSIAASITRYHYPPELRDEYDKIAKIIDNLIDRIRRKKEKTGLFYKHGDDAFDKSPVQIATDVRLRMLNLYQDRFPQEDWFSHPGGHVVDNSIVYDDTTGMYHFFYNYGTGGYSAWEELENKIGHAISADLINWKNLQPVVYTSLDEFDCYMSWCPQVLKFDEYYYMFYTGVNENASQANALARSQDLYNWEKLYGNQIHYPGDWYTAYTKESWSDERDPMVLIDGDKAYIYYCSFADGVGTVLGVASTDISEFKGWEDWTKWTDEGYRVMPTGSDRNCESPYVVKMKDKYYCFYSPAGQGTTVTTSDSPLGEWKGMEELTPGRNASEILYDEINDRYIISEITKDAFDIQFAVFQELIFTENGDVRLKDIEMPEIRATAAGTNKEDECLLTISLSLPVWEYSSEKMLDRYANYILLNGVSIGSISEDTQVTIDYNAAERSLKIHMKDSNILTKGENVVTLLSEFPLLTEGHELGNDMTCEFTML